MNGLTNATSQVVAWCPKHQTAKWCCWFDGHSLTRLGSQKTSPPAPNSPLQNPSNFGATASHWLLYFLLFFFFLIFNRMHAWSLMRGDTFIHFVCGNRRVNIRLGVLLLISKSPHRSNSEFWAKNFEVVLYARSTWTSLFTVIWYRLES